MAGIGFELKKLFNRRGLFAAFRAYGYAGVVCTGPMLLGVVLLLGVMFLCDITGSSRHSRELLVCMITYTLLASLTVTSFLSMVVTRFIADQLYEENYEAVLPSFWGSSGLMLIVGGILYGVFLIFSGAGLLDGFLCFGFFWRADHYLECDELSYCDQRLQRNSPGFYRSDRGDISDRVDSPYDRDSTC